MSNWAIHAKEIKDNQITNENGKLPKIKSDDKVLLFFRTPDEDVQFVQTADVAGVDFGKNEDGQEVLISAKLENLARLDSIRLLSDFK